MNPLGQDRITFSRKCGIDPAIFVLYWVYSKIKECPRMQTKIAFFDIDGTLIDSPRCTSISPPSAPRTMAFWKAVRVFSGAR